jgi:hypothetical protein
MESWGIFLAFGSHYSRALTITELNKVIQIYDFVVSTLLHKTYWHFRSSTFPSCCKNRYYWWVTHEAHESGPCALGPDQMLPTSQFSCEEWQQDLAHKYENNLTVLVRWFEHNIFKRFSKKTLIYLIFSNLGNGKVKLFLCLINWAPRPECVWRSGGTAPPFLTAVTTRCRWVVSFTL